MQLINKTAIITGAASGLGQATSRHFINQGAHVALWDMNKEHAQCLSKELGENAKAYYVDVTDEKSIKVALNQTVNDFGDIHINGNFAGISHGERIVDKHHQPHQLAHFEKIIAINLIGTFNVLRLCAAQMSKQECIKDTQQRGVIINTASVAGHEGQVGQAAYASSKAALIGSTICYARDLAQFGIRVNTIAPGLIHTPMFDQFPEKVFNALEASVLFPKRLGKANEIAQLAQHIVENDYLNGECIRMDGGIRMQEK